LYCKGAGKLKGRTLAILEELLQLRESQAETVDRPPFKVLAAETLLNIAETTPRTMTELSRIKGMTPSQINRYATGILQAVISGMEMPEDALPRFPRTRKNDVIEGSKERLKHLKCWREQRSGELGLEPGLLAPNWLLESVAEFSPATYSGLESIPGVRQWQKDLCAVDMIRISAETTSEG
jgi:ribonuclease D